jgi:phenylacetate-CoA ligase
MSVSYEDILEMFMESQHWPPDVMRDFQRTQLDQLLRHARTNVPFYKTRLNCMFRKDDSIDWERWNDIPVLTRQDVQTHRQDLLAQGIPEGHGTWQEFTTSGSTARPITIRVPELMGLANLAVWVRFYRSHGIPDSAKFAFVRTTRSDGAPLGGDSFATDFRKSDGNAKLTIVQRHMPSDRKLQLLFESRPDVLVDSPNALEILARQNLKRPEPLHVKWVVGYGMGFSAEQLDMVKRSFATTVLETYCSKEAGPIALKCPKCMAYHVNEELLHLEQGLSGPESLIVTPFFQSAQPFIRYMQNDRVHIRRGSTCGHQQLIITTIDGRVDPIFKLPDGVEVSAIGVGIAKSSFQKICVATQLAQTSLLDFEMRYVADREVNQQEAESIEKTLRHEIHKDLRVSFRRVDDIPYNAGGKQQRFVREFDVT